VITGFIRQTTKTLNIAVQELDSVAIAEAVIAKKREGKSVGVLLNRSYLQDATDAEHRPDPALTTAAQLAADQSERKVNREVVAALCRCGVEVRIDLTPTTRSSTTSSGSAHERRLVRARVESDAPAGAWNPMRRRGA
jgi:hypothetical protein